jgi:hypothetical protein
VENVIWRMNNVERRGGSKNKHLVLVMVRIKTSSWFFIAMRIVAPNCEDDNIFIDC